MKFLWKETNKNFKNFIRFFILPPILIEISSKWLYFLPGYKTLIARVLMWIWWIYQLIVRILMLIKCTLTGIGRVVIYRIGLALYDDGNVPLSWYSIPPLSDKTYKDGYHINKEKLKKKPKHIMFSTACIQRRKMNLKKFNNIKLNMHDYSLLLEAKIIWKRDANPI